MQDFSDYLSPINVYELNEDNEYTDGQFAKHIAIYEKEMPDLTHIDLVILGIGEMRGCGLQNEESHAANEIRKKLYLLHCWHDEITIADIGNIKEGALLFDSYAAMQTILSELINSGKTVIILGGSHDITIAQYNSYKSLNRIIEATCIDALIDLRGDSMLKSDSFLLEMLTSEPNWIKHYNHIGFQSYFVHPRLLETLDKLRFDCYRVGLVKEDIEEMEPVIRNSHFVSFDISAIKNSSAPANKISPNGFNGEEACTLAQYAGLSSNLSSFGIYGYQPEHDVNQLTALQIAQMIWYFIDGKYRSKQEADINERSSFNQYHTFFAEVDTVFLQSKRSNRWWMQMPDKNFIACSHKDYKKASMDEMPERWLRAQERG
ncbi:MAG: formimidoylglutamase [Bacteroidota bacterium]